MTAVTETILYKRLLPKFNAFAKQSRAFNIYSEFSGITMDFVTGYQFGLAAGSNTILDDVSRTHFLDLYDSRKGYNFWPQEMPGLTSFLGSIGIGMVPKWVDAANTEIDAWCLKMCDDASSFLARTKATCVEDVPTDEVANFPVVYSQLQSGMTKSKKASAIATPEQDRLEIASELIDHFAAGFDTSGITLVYVIHELSLHPEIQTALRKELRTLDPSISIQQSQETSPVLPSAKAVDSLPLLDAIIEETLRLHAAIPGPEPRVTPSGGCTLGPEGEYKNIPGGVRISAQGHSLHRNPDVFTNPEEWIPDRWINPTEGKATEMKRWFWAFGSGGRMCVGSNLALYRKFHLSHLTNLLNILIALLTHSLEMKYIVAAIYTNFMTTIVDDDGVEQMDLYTAPPKSGKLVIKLECLE